MTRTLNSQKEAWIADAIAVIGMAGRFPSAPSVEDFWYNLINGVDSVRRIEDAELESLGIDRNYLDSALCSRAGALIDEADTFDPNFFGYSPGEAEVMDPQQRIFLECCWESLEDAGYDVNRYKGMVGVYAGSGPDGHILNLYLNEHPLVTEGPLQLQIGNGPWSLTTRVSYKLNLRGPSFFVQTACSTSLVAVHLACQSLRNFECHMALAGGVSVVFPQRAGFCFEGGGITAASERCRAFDKDADGTVFGQGAGVVVLKRLEDAIVDNDNIRGVIRGTAINNDGLNKVGFTAPSVDGQAAVIAAALADADVDASTIGYIETHGTGTQLGDPVEIRALCKAFGRRSIAPGTCAIGSVKTNIGHLDAAAGVAGLIKTIKSLEHGMIVPSLHYQTANPEIDFGKTPFYVNTKLRAWERSGGPRRAGVSSFGFGGTNAHVVLEEAAETQRATNEEEDWQLLVLSARSASALEAAQARLADHLERHPEINLADAAYTLQTGRSFFTHRRRVVAHTAQEARDQLREPAVARVSEGERLEIAFLFPGQAAQHPNMAHDLYLREPIFRRELDHCLDRCREHSGEDLKGLLFSPRDPEVAAEQLKQTRLAQPALFAVEYALAKMWMALGVVPTAMIGHSLGEYTAACLAGVFTLEEAVYLLVKRGEIVQRTQPGLMLAVIMSEADVRERLNADLSLATVNGPHSCVVSGTNDAGKTFESELQSEGISCLRLSTSHAFHCALMEPAIPQLRDVLMRVNLQKPRIPFVSNVTGRWIAPDEATNVDYWTKHLIETVRFADGLRCLFERPNLICLEAGPSQTLTQLVQANTEGNTVRAFASLPRRGVADQDRRQMLTTLGELWCHGVEINWAALHQQRARRRVSLPTYPFERSRFPLVANGKPRTRSTKHAMVNGWFYAPSWQRDERLAFVPADLSAQQQNWLLLTNENEPVGCHLTESLRTLGQAITIVNSTESFSALLEELAQTGKLPDRIVHLWSIRAEPTNDWEESQRRGLYSILQLAQSLAAPQFARPRELYVLTAGTQAVLGDEVLHPENATMIGPCRVLPVEDPMLSCRLIDFDLRDRPEELAEKLLAEITRSGPTITALRGDYRWIPHFAQRELPATQNSVPIRDGGVYLITGGRGGIGFTIAQHFAKQKRVRLVLVSRTPAPADDARLRKLEESGAEVLSLAADVSDYEQMRAVVAQMLDRFGAINGVVHAAGVPDRGSYQQKALSDMHDVLAPKVKGALVLSSLLEKEKLDFLVLCSSVSALVGAYGESVYSGANAFVDVLAQALRKEQKLPVVSVNWCAWQQVGLAANAHVPDHLKEAVARELSKGLLPGEGVEALDRILAHGNLPQVVVCKTDLEELLQKGPLSQAYARSDERSVRYPRPAIDQPYVAPATDLERNLAAVWQEVLCLEKVGRNDAFFELGGNSLIATQLIWKMRQRAGVEVPLRVLFEVGTIGGLAHWIESASHSNGSKQSATIPKRTGDADVPLSFEQEQLWFQDQLEPGSLAYNIPFGVELKGPFKLKRVERALRAIVRRHETLRTSFVAVDGHPKQIVNASDEVALTVVDLAELPTASRDAFVHQLINRCIRRPFDLARGPLFRATVLRLDTAEHILLVELHHIVADNWSTSILVREFIELYAGHDRGGPISLEELPIQYADYACWQRQSLTSARIEELVGYWKRQLSNLPQLKLREEKLVHENGGAEGGAEPLVFSSSRFESLRMLSRAENVTTFMVLLAIFMATLKEFSSQNDIVIGADVTNRRRPELEDLVGFFINMQVLRVDLTAEASLRELLERVRETVAAAIAHQDLPFWKLVQEVNPQRSGAHSPLFRAVLNYQHAPSQNLQLPGLAVTPLVIEELAVRFDLSVTITETPNGIDGVLRYNRRVISDDLARRIKDVFMIALDKASNDPNSTVEELLFYARKVAVDSGASAKTQRPFVPARKPIEISEVASG